MVFSFAVGFSRRLEALFLNWGLSPFCLVPGLKSLKKGGGGCSSRQLKLTVTEERIPQKFKQICPRHYQVSVKYLCFLVFQLCRRLQPTEGGSFLQWGFSPFFFVAGLKSLKKRGEGCLNRQLKLTVNEERIPQKFRLMGKQC